MNTIIQTKMGPVKGNASEGYNEFLGIRFATAGRFEYAVPVDSFDGEYDATAFGPACPQTRGFYPHFEHPTRRFYHHEFREGQVFTYGEDCLRLNIYAPLEAKNCPVILFFYGGGFNAGSTDESTFDGAIYARQGIILVTAAYRVGILGYLTHEEVYKKYGRDGNFGLDDQFTAINWVKSHIADFGGDPGNITLAGQSAGAMSVQYLCLNEKCRGLFKRAIMFSGAGLFPKFSLPRPAAERRPYWTGFMESAGIKTFDELKTMDFKEIFARLEPYLASRKDNVFNTMPVLDGYHLTAPVDELIKKPLPLDYMIGYSNNDMYAIIMSHIGHRFAKDNNGFIYYFDIDAPGDKRNAAYHACDLRYIFGTLDCGTRKYGPYDHEVSALLTRYISAFAATGDPNSTEWPITKQPGVSPEYRLPSGLLPIWERGGKKALRFAPDTIEMAHPNRLKLLWNTLTKGDPKLY